MIKYILILILSFQVSAEVTDDAAAGICAVMKTQLLPESINAGIIKYWETAAKRADMSLSEYHKMCTTIVDNYKSNQDSKKTADRGGKL